MLSVAAVAPFLFMSIFTRSHRPTVLSKSFVSVNIQFRERLKKHTFWGVFGRNSVNGFTKINIVPSVPILTVSSHSLFG